MIQISIHAIQFILHIASSNTANAAAALDYLARLTIIAANDIANMLRMRSSRRQ